MAHEKKCPVCQKTYWGNLNKLFCSDGCRKYAKRHPEKVSVSSSQINPVLGQGIVLHPVSSGKARTNTSGVLNHAAKKMIDVLAHKLMESGGKSSTPNKQLPQKPLVVGSLNMISAIGNISRYGKNIDLPEAFQAFLGQLYFPFKMLVWGTAGQGKSTFCMQFAEALTAYPQLIYISGEEDPYGPTFLSKVNRSLSKESLHKMKVLNRLPNIREWQGLMKYENGQPVFRHVLYDSVSVLDITPEYPRIVARNQVLSFFDTHVNHIFITHAQKDGKTYLGPSMWGHDVDIIVKVHNGVAYIEKNRFATSTAGLIGSTYNIFE